MKVQRKHHGHNRRSGLGWLVERYSDDVNTQKQCGELQCETYDSSVNCLETIIMQLYP